MLNFWKKTFVVSPKNKFCSLARVFLFSLCLHYFMLHLSVRVSTELPGEIGLNISVIAINGPGNALAKPNFALRAIVKNSSRQLKTEEEMQIGQRSDHHDD